MGDAFNEQMLENGRVRCCPINILCKSTLRRAFNDLCWYRFKERKGTSLLNDEGLMNRSCGAYTVLASHHHQSKPDQIHQRKTGAVVTDGPIAKRHPGHFWVPSYQDCYCCSLQQTKDWVLNSIYHRANDNQQFFQINIHHHPPPQQKADTSTIISACNCCAL